MHFDDEMEILIARESSCILNHKTDNVNKIIAISVESLLLVVNDKMVITTLIIIISLILYYLVIIS